MPVPKPDDKGIDNLYIDTLEGIVVSETQPSPEDNVVLWVEVIPETTP